ncbi:MAG: TolC family protein [Chryseolinea sp.]
MKFRLVIGIFLSLAVLAPVFGQDAEVSVEEVVALALQENYDVRLYRNLAESAGADNSYAVGGFLPVINGTGSKTWNVVDQHQILASGSEIMRDNVRSNNLSGSVQLNWLVFDGLRMFATLERLSQINEQGELNVKNQMVNTVAEVVLNYYNVVRQKQQLNAIQEQMSVSEERVRLADRRLQVGTGAKPELLQAKVDLNAQRTLVLQQQIIITQLKDQLNGLVSNKLPSVFDVSDSIIIDLSLQQEQISNDVVRTSYNLQSYKKSIDIAELLLRERKGERYPFISLTSSYNFSETNNAVAVNQFTLLYNQNQGYNYGIGVTLPIINGFSNRRSIQQARLTLNRQRILYDQALTNVDVGIKNAYVNYDNSKKVLLIEEENILLAKENLYITLETFKRSGNTFIEVRTAQQSLADAYNRLINARYLTKVAETNLLRLNGSILREN